MAYYDAGKARSEVRNLAARAGAWVGMALQPGVEYVLTIGANNPPEKVAKRKDVSAALTHAATGGFAKAAPLLQKAWESGRKHGARNASDQWGEKLSVPDIDTDVFERLQADIAKILSEAPGDMLSSYVAGGEQGLLRAQRRAAYRVSLAVDAAFSHAEAAASIQALQSTNSLKKWVTHSATPCSHCVHLASLPPIPWDEEFPADVPGLPMLPVYTKKFLGPPRHPNCRCTLALAKA